MFPSPPDDIEEILLRCKKKNQYEEVAYEWYKYVAQVALTSASLDINSPLIRFQDKSNYGVLIGLLSRVSRLMLSNMKLSSGALHGETTTILDRCINESAIKVIWLCHDYDENKFDIFKAKALWTEVKLKEEINQNILKRKGEILPIEDRMLASINKYIDESKLTEEKIKKLRKKMPNMADIMRSISMKDLHYTVIMNIGSHSLHGTWVSLKRDYYTENEAEVHLKDMNESYTHINQYLSVSTYALECLKCFFQLIFHDGHEKENIKGLFDDIKKEILNIWNLHEQSICK